MPTINLVKTVSNLASVTGLSFTATAVQSNVSYPLTASYSAPNLTLTSAGDIGVSGNFTFNVTANYTAFGTACSDSISFVEFVDSVICSPTEMIQFEYGSGGDGWICYTNNINNCTPNPYLNTVSARKVQVGSSMKWTMEDNTPSGWLGSLQYFLQERGNVEANAGNYITPSYTNPTVVMQMHTPGGHTPLWYEYNPSSTTFVFAANTATSADYEMLVLPNGRLEFKRNNVTVFTSTVVFDVVSKEYIFGTTQDNSPYGCRSNFRFENMGGFASWTVI
jgi:hypothetical protein